MSEGRRCGRASRVFVRVIPTNRPEQAREAVWRATVDENGQYAPRPGKPPERRRGLPRFAPNSLTPAALARAARSRRRSLNDPGRRAGQTIWLLRLNSDNIMV